MNTVPRIDELSVERLSVRARNHPSVKELSLLNMASVLLAMLNPERGAPPIGDGQVGSTSISPVTASADT